MCGDVVACVVVGGVGVVDGGVCGVAVGDGVDVVVGVGGGYAGDCVTAACGVGVVHWRNGAVVVGGVAADVGVVVGCRGVDGVVYFGVFDGVGYVCNSGVGRDAWAWVVCGGVVVVDVIILVVAYAVIGGIVADVVAVIRCVDDVVTMFGIDHDVVYVGVALFDRVTGVVVVVVTNDDVHCGGVVVVVGYPSSVDYGVG